MPPRGGIMLGTSRSGSGDRLGEWEMLRIDSDAAGMAYHASPQGRGWTRFARRNDKARGITFVDPAHDYPQRIRYWRDGPRLVAEIALIDGGRARRWTYAPTRR